MADDGNGRDDRGAPSRRSRRRAPTKSSLITSTPDKASFAKTSSAKRPTDKTPSAKTLTVGRDASTTHAHVTLAEGLRAVIEARIIPELTGGHVDDPTGDARLQKLRQSRRIGDGTAVQPMRPRQIPQATIGALSDALIANDIAVARQMIEVERGFGATDETLMLDALPPVARDLGQRWLEDRCTFADVTVGLGALQVLLRDLSLDKPMFQRGAARRRRIRLLSMLPEQHTFGVLIVAEFFRFEGWDVVVGQPTDIEELERDVAGLWYDTVGFSISVDRHLDGLGSVIGRLRAASCNPDLKIIAGGPLLDRLPQDALVSYGVDAVAAHAGVAVRTALNLFEEVANLPTELTRTRAPEARPAQ